MTKSPAPIDSAKVEDTGEPVTRKMLEAAKKYLPDYPYPGWADDIRGMYQAMRVAAPAAPTTGSAPSAEYTQGWQDCLRMHAASPAPSVLTAEKIVAILRAYTDMDALPGDALVIALLAASIGGEKS